MGPCTAILAIGLLCLSAPAQNNSPIPNTPWYFPPVPHEPNNPKPKNKPAKQADTGAPQSAPTLQDSTTQRVDLLLGTINPSQYQPDPDLGLFKLDIAVTDEKGRAVAGLGAKDLTLLDNGQPRDIVTFEAFDHAASKPAQPVEIILVIDEMDLAPEFLNDAKQAVQKFLLQNGGHLAQPTKVYRIAKDGLFVSSRPSKDGMALAKEVAESKQPRTIWKSEELGKIVKLPLEQSDQRSVANSEWTELPHPLIALGSIAIEERRAPERKLLFWFGNGWPIRSNSKWQHLFDTVTELSTRLREARIGVWVNDFWRRTGEDDFKYQDFVAGVTSEQSLKFEDVALQVLAVQSGGGVLRGVGDAADLVGQQVAQANTFYTITFDPPRTQVVDEYHDLRVTISKPGLTAHTRNGYYNEPVYYDQARLDAKDVTVAQLRDALIELQRASDSEAERRLRGMELTERLSSPELEKLLVGLKGRRAQQALTAVADQSVFYPPPAEESLTLQPPGIADQRQIIQRTVSYVSKMISILPNLSAERTTTLYVEPPRATEQPWKTAAGDHYLEPASAAKAEVQVFEGQETVQETSVNVIRKTSQSKSLHTEGAFGPILAAVLIAVSKPESRLMWARWEKGTAGPVAVFRYNIPKDTPIFKVEYCCLAVDFGQIKFETYAPTNGEITVDPETGAILRFTMRAGLSWRLPLQHSDIMIEYGPVVLGETSYICPIRGVSISRPRSIVQVSEFNETFKTYAPFETILNDVKYENYHLFRSSSRVLPGFSEPPEVK